MPSVFVIEYVLLIVLRAVVVHLLLHPPMLRKGLNRDAFLFFDVHLWVKSDQQMLLELRLHVRGEFWHSPMMSLLILLIKPSHAPDNNHFPPFLEDI